MDEATYKQWCPLHWRTALGEPLSAEEQARYEAGLRQLEAEEHIGFDMAGSKGYVEAASKSWQYSASSPMSRCVWL